MAVSTFKYCDQDFLSTLFGRYIDYLPVKQILNWRTIAVNIYAGERVGFDGVLYVDKKDLASFKLTQTTAATDTTLDGNVAIDAVTFDVDSVTNIAAGTVIQMGAEKIFVVSVATLTLTVIRGFLGTTRIAHLDGKAVSLIGLAFNAENEWYYDTASDMVIIYTATAPGQSGAEMGEDKDTFFDQTLINASMELNSNLDSRHTIPIPKAYQYGSAPSTDTPEYDFVIKKLTAFIAMKNLMLANGEDIEAMNHEIDTITDKINSGKIKLRYEKDDTDPKGNVIEITRAGTMYLVETYGEYAGSQLSDRIQILCTTGGAYGTAIVSVKQSDGNALYANVTTGIKITGDMDYMTNGIYVRFQGASMTADDRWDIEVKNPALENTNDEVTSTELCR
mgnify:CR=1 FL=1|jgi:hypothetical protein